MTVKEAILLAGGLGTRLQKTVPDLPKPMAPVHGRPFVEYIMDFLIKHGIRKFIFSVGYKHEIFASHFNDDYNGCPVLFSVEHEPLGTGGGIKKAFAYTESPEVLVVNADTIFKLDITAMYASHKKTNADLTIALRNMQDVSRYGSVEMSEDLLVTGFLEKNVKTGAGYINAGVYLFKNDFFRHSVYPAKFSLEKDCLEKQPDTLKIGGFLSKGYFLDIGIPEDYEKANNDFERL